jgi:hypothetical protein
MSNLRSSVSQATDDPFLATLFRPSSAYQHPADILGDQDLTLYEKRSILSSWASDAWTVESRPSLRAPAALAEPVSIDEILMCLRRLDEEMERRCFGSSEDGTSQA